ncbi:MAG: FtsX-like permease family protein [Chlorogloeopsis fritschii C42_A2020_084]|uniref:ABC transporter permease DevC n=1 Tax=Chlorogloeopsis fritschii TaxID=1124 RepID=UPI001A099198|nr:ABC transporter permease DevC [Chlorogloeopsis fritschii]MBF2005747.1 FtsX-like permease family protein [Chlorogloeopsis fritschii C42_A2020_084]
MKLLNAKTLLGDLFVDPPLGWAQLRHQKLRLIVALAGIAFADILIFMQLGFKALLLDGSTLVHKNLRGDLVLVSQRTKSLLEGQAFSRRHLYQAAAVEGVASASPLYFSFGGWVNPWKKEVNNIAVIAFDPAQPVFNLPDINQQLNQIKLQNVVLFDSKSQPDLGPIAESFTQGQNITTEISGHRVKVGGIFTLGSSIFTRGHVVTSDWNYLRLFGADSIDKIHVGVLTLKPWADAQNVIKNIQTSLPSDIKAITRQEFIDQEQAYWAADPAGVIFNFGTIMGFIVGVVIVYQILYSDVNNHLSEYATLKAMGYTDMSLLVVVFQEAIILAVLGFIPGFACSIGMYGLLGNLTRIPILMRLDVALQVFTITVVMCLVSAGVAMRRLQSADPADVF